MPVRCDGKCMYLSGRVDKCMVEKTVLCLIGSFMVRDGKQHEMAYGRIIEQLLQLHPQGAMLAIEDMMCNWITMPTHLMHVNIGTCKRKHIMCTPCTPSCACTNTCNVWRWLARISAARLRPCAAAAAVACLRGHGAYAWMWRLTCLSVHGGGSDGLPAPLCGGGGSSMPLCSGGGGCGSPALLCAGSNEKEGYFQNSPS